MFCARRLELGTIERVPVARLEHGVPPADGDDLSLRPVRQLQPVADVNAPVELERDAAHDVAERRLHAERQHSTDHRGGGDHRRRGDPGRLHHAEPGEDVGQADDEVAGDGHRPEAERGQCHVEHRQREEVDQGERRKEVAEEAQVLGPRRRRQPGHPGENDRRRGGHEEQRVEDEPVADAVPLLRRHPIDDERHQQKHAAEQREPPCVYELGQWHHHRLR